MKSTRWQPASTSASSPSSLGKLVLFAVIAAAAILAGVYFLPVDQQDDAELLRNAQAALSREQYDEAEKIAGLIEATSPQFSPARLIAGEAAMRSGRHLDAIDYFKAIDDEDSEAGLRASFALGELYRADGQLEEAIAALKRVSAVLPNNGDAHARLAFLLGVTGQRWESVPHYMALIRTNNWTVDSLSMLADVERPIEQPEFLQECLSKHPEEDLAKLGWAVHLSQNGDEAKALKYVNEVVKQRPTFWPAQALLGELLVAAEPEQFAAWEASLLKSSAEHPDIWFARGMGARGRNELELAAGCFAEAIRLAPEHRRATYQLSQVLTALDDPAANQFTERADQLIELTQSVDQVLLSKGQSEAAMQATAELMLKTGRKIEAWAWATTASQVFSTANWAAPMAQQIASELGNVELRTVSEANLITQIALDKYRQLAQQRVAKGDLETKVADAAGGAQSKASSSAMQFSIADLGIALVYENGADPATPGARMFEQTGGGVGVIDFDLDGWPDVYFTQGSKWPTGAKVANVDSKYSDHLYRNLDGKQMVESIQQTGVDGLGFGQGIAVGDFNADGFPDLLVTNIGRNRLWENNGDGTFRDATEQMIGDPARWSTSAAIVDLNNDTLPDLYVADYLMGEKVFELICGNRGCSPKVFNGAPDEFYLNQGDGTFLHLDGATPQQDAKGLGLLIGRFGGESQPSVFVANDQVPNFFLQGNASAEGEFAFTDQALLRGLAYNVDGLAMACMGIAADDLDGNGRIDLLVTNFKDEPNSLYLQDAPGLFVDITRSAGLLGPSYPYVGWGTQFIDVDLDGQSDLVVTNGHIDDYRDEGGMYQMPPQLFRNRGRARFAQIEREQAGDYFARDYLGRGLAKLDWDRDGRTEFAVSNIGQPALITHNDTPTENGFLNVRLQGTVSDRDSLGATVDLVAGTIKLSKQLVTGDGYHAANERMLQFGLGEQKLVESLIVHWPSGGSSQLSDVSVNANLRIVEGLQQAWSEDGRQWPVIVHSKP